jgi:hypothetical protein
MAITPINGLSSSFGPAGIFPVHGIGPAAPGAAGAERGSAALDPVSGKTSSAFPPPEVLAAIARASAAVDDLAAQGRHVSFNESESGGLTMSLEDPHGKLLSTLTAGDVLSLADGDAPTQRARPASATTPAA